MGDNPIYTDFITPLMSSWVYAAQGNKEKAIKELVNMMESNVNDGLDYQGKCCICHSACIEDAKKVKTLVEDMYCH